ncbi:MAG TPA: hypothetical protein VNV63_04985 [Nitrospiria bacterium]|jgi:hypothetical protein|nr:hypothetical protein [Nitrospiria bacterium]
MKITNQELAELFKSALVAYENEPDKGVGPDGYCYDTLAGGRVAIEMAAKILLQPPQDDENEVAFDTSSFLRRRLKSVMPKDRAVEAVQRWLLKRAWTANSDNVDLAELIVGAVRMADKGFREVLK